MKRQLLLVVAIGLLSQSAPAQIVFDSEFFLNFGQRLESGYSGDTVSAADSLTLLGIIAQSGPNQTWDFSSIMFESTGEFTAEFFDSADGLPGADEPAFSQANRIVKAFFRQVQDDGTTIEGTAHNYFRVNADALLSLGGVVDVPSFGQLTFISTPPDTNFVLPLTYMTAWTSTTEQSNPFGSTTTKTAAVVDGHGTLMLPNGVSADALRIKRDQTITVSGFDFTDTTYEFWTLEGHFASIFHDDGLFGSISASYTVAGDFSGVAIEDADELPNALRLEQNYPNPFNPQTVIPFELGGANHVSLRIHDTLGREIVTLIDQTLPAGRHEVAWSATDLPSGVYFYSLSVGGQSKTRSLLLLQ